MSYSAKILQPETVGEAVTLGSEMDSLFHHEIEDRDLRIQKLLADWLAEDSLAFEIRDETGDLAGVISFANVRPGEDADADFVFFTGYLGEDEADVCRRAAEWVFTEREGWEPLHRLTIKVPRETAVLAAFVERALGFGGPFIAEWSGREIPVEAVLREATRWDGERTDYLILGLLREDFLDETV